MPILQPPGSEVSAPPSQPSTEAVPSAAKPLSLNGRPLILSSAASWAPSLTPFGALHCDRPLMTTSDRSVRAASLFQITSSRRRGSFGNRMLALILVPSGPSTSPNTMLRLSYLTASLRWVASLVNTPPHVTVLAGAAATRGFGAGLGLAFSGSACGCGWA